MNTRLLTISILALSVACSCSSGNPDEEETGKHLSRKEMQEKMSHIGTGLPYIPEGKTKPVAKEVPAQRTVTTVTFDPAVPGQESSTTVTTTPAPVAKTAAKASDGGSQQYSASQQNAAPKTQPAGQFAIICGSFKEKSGADVVLKAANAKGYQGFVKTGNSGMTTVYLCPGTAEEAKAAFKKVSKESFCPKDAWVGKIK